GVVGRLRGSAVARGVRQRGPGVRGDRLYRGRGAGLPSADRAREWVAVTPPPESLGRRRGRRWPSPLDRTPPVGRPACAACRAGRTGPGRPIGPATSAGRVRRLARPCTGSRRTRGTAVGRPAG